MCGLLYHVAAPSTCATLAPRRPQGCARDLQDEPDHDEPEAQAVQRSIRPFSRSILSCSLSWASSDK